MRRLDPGDLSSAQVDALRSLAGFGSADAARSLGQLVGGGVEMGAARAALYRREAAAEALPVDQEGVAVRFRAEGGARVRLMVQFTTEGASLVASHLLADASNGELYRSALAEAANIVVSSYLSGVGSAVGMTLVPSVPSVNIGRMGEAAALAFGDSDAALLLITEFRLSGLGFAGIIIAAPEGDALESLLAPVGAL